MFCLEKLIKEHMNLKVVCFRNEDWDDLVNVAVTCT
jgi:hypothetical protein